MTNPADDEFIEALLEAMKHPIKGDWLGCIRTSNRDDNENTETGNPGASS